MTLLFLQEKKKVPRVTALLPVTLIVTAGNITRKCEEPEAAEAFLKKLENELHYKLGSNKDELTELGEIP